MEYKRKDCWCCANYSAYYTKKLCCFERSDCGFCRAENAIITDKHHTCEKWRFNGFRRKIRKNVALKALNRELNHLVEIRQILVEEMNDNKSNPI